MSECFGPWDEIRHKIISMITSRDIDKNLLRKSKLYTSFYLSLFTVILILLVVISPVLTLLYLIAVFSSIPVLGFILRKKKNQFNCIKCGLCCALMVEPDEKEIKKIERNIGQGRDSFMEGRYLKRVNGYCTFLKNKNSENICSIYKFRPKICRGWPFKNIRPLSLAICPSLRKLFLRDRN